MPEFRFTAIIPFPREEVSDYISDPRHWPEFFAELTEFDRPQLMRDLAKQAGLPDIEHERVLDVVPEGTRLDNIARFQPRPGLAGLRDRTVLRWAAQRMYQRMYDRAVASLVTRLTDRQRPGFGSA